MIYVGTYLERHCFVQSVNTGAACIDQILHRILATGLQDIQKTGNIAFVGPDGIINGTGNGPQGGLVQDNVNIGAGTAAGVQIADVPFQKGKPIPSG